MSAFTSHIDIYPITSSNRWGLGSPIVWDLLYKWSGYQFTVPAGFEFDGASVPKWLWWLYQKVEADTIHGACLHDAGYTSEREQAEKLRTRMKSDGVIPKDITLREFVDFHLFYEPMRIRMLSVLGYKDGDIPKSKRRKQSRRKFLIMYIGVRWFWYPVRMKWI